MDCLSALLPDDHLVGVAIGPNQIGGWHLGFVYRPKAGARAKFLHHAWHNWLRNDDATPAGYLLALFGRLPRSAHPLVTAECKRAVRADLLGGFRYGFGFQAATVSVDAAGRMTVEGASGLTCATFVLALLGRAGIDTIQLDTWKHREGDDEAKALLIQMLERDRNVTKEHLDAVRADAHHVRIRPEDVAGAALELPPRVAFERAVTLGNRVLNDLASQPLAQESAK